MLIETPIKKGDTVSLKLTSGEEIIARYEEENDNYIVVYKPLGIVPSQQGMALAPYMFSVKEDAKFLLRTNSVSCIVKTEPGLASQYTQQTTGLSLAT